jgi:4-hydroxy-tetrahydrodipicolinate reductase
MAVRVVVAGATGWTGKALVEAIRGAGDLELAATIARKAAGTTLGGVPVFATLAEALAVPSDVVVDYTHPTVVKDHVLTALAGGRNVVVGTSGLSAGDYRDIDAAAKAAGRGVIAAGNFSITATLLTRFAVEAAKYVADIEIIDYASAKKPDVPSGTAREIAERIAGVRKVGSAVPVADVIGPKDARGAAMGEGTPVQLHSVRLPSFVLSAEVILGAPDERLTLRHDAGSSAAPYVAGTLLAVRKVVGRVGLTRGLDSLI